MALGKQAKIINRQQVEALDRLVERLPSLDASVFIASANGSIDLLSTNGAPCPFIARLTLSA